MAHRLSERQLALVFVVALGLAIGGLFAYVEVSQPSPVVARGLVTASLVIEGPGWTIRYGPVTTPNNTAFSLLLESSAQLGFAVEEVHYTFPSGVLVTAINGTVNGQQGAYWQYWVNGVYADIGADHYVLVNGDIVTWHFTTNQGGMAA